MPLLSTRGAGSAKGFGFGGGASPFIIATGGTVTTCGNYKIHTFTGPGSFVESNAGKPTGSDTVDYLVVAGGGGGNGGRVGGGGAGGFRESKAPGAPWTASPLASSTSLPVSAQSYPITVGAGGTAGDVQSSPQIQATNGNNSIFSTITSTGGGSIQPCAPDGAGGSGRGATAPGGTIGQGNTPPVSPPQGNPGGSGDMPGFAAGAGGGAGGAGGNGSGTGGTGGVGVSTSITGSPLAYAGGGAGGASVGFGGTPGSGSPCGTGGGAGVAGTTNRGGGGGSNSSQPCLNGGAGGSGVVVIRYKFQ